MDTVHSFLKIIVGEVKKEAKILKKDYGELRN